MSEPTLKYNGPVPEGYELTGEVRPAMAGETYILYIVDGLARITVCDKPTSNPVVILRPKKWKPNTGEVYWVLRISHSSGLPRVAKDMWQDCVCESMWSDSGNCFRTQEEAEAMAEKIRTLFKEAHQ